MWRYFVLTSCFLLTVLSAVISQAESPNRSLRIGYIGSQTGFAAAYGQAVLQGVKLAVDELSSSGVDVQLFVEDDRSIPRDLLTAYTKLKTINKIEALITGSWWADSIVNKVSKDGIPFVSCETLYGKDFVRAANYFSLQGDFRDWIRVFAPLVDQRKWKTAAMVRFVSGTADTWQSELENLFSTNRRKFIKAIEYADFDMKEAATIATQIKMLAPEVVYIDAQPSSFGVLMNRLIEQHAENLVVLTHSVARDAQKEKLFSPAAFQGEIYFTARETFDPGFMKKFETRYKRKPELNSDLGYYALHLLRKAFAEASGPVEALASGKLRVGGIRFQFDENNVFRGLKQEVYTFRSGKSVKISD